MNILNDYYGLLILALITFGVIFILIGAYSLKKQREEISNLLTRIEAILDKLDESRKD